jgi:hypothetical protein
MWKNTGLFFLASLFTAVPVTWISVYVLHDVDPDFRSKLNEAYFNVVLEFFLFAIIAAILFGVVVAVGTLLFRLQLRPTASKLSIWLGVGLLILQYVWDLLSRIFLSETWKERMLAIYMFGGPVACALLLLAIKGEWVRNVGAADRS